ncbi:MAG TPA: type I restriction enzyme HsdR N-terminal domain-containing protein [Oscillatoriales cyanobacterium M59_W2019_021]|nr:MAG: restriction endonuclease subunit R [Cyanobacteria bacterium J055]HIK30392.1 type I restriction enzyme HsdR N-terminal domain-containing protein [Oscillatoriales cyanobacterium M4454_W2019_049]HIK50305.1 type I restriction enzyme HsdR N-terminal domain-containing protein [Oscillatoriales cyanobacterium M59_W2019_021]
MVQTIAAEGITLYQLEKNFGLIEINNPEFFPEWQTNLPELHREERQRLDRVKAAYANLARRSVLENTVKMAIVSPLLDLAGFFFPPFYVETEESVEIISTDGEITVRGRIDVLILKEQFWVLVIESKRAEFSVKVGIPQVLSYMLARPNSAGAQYGLVTNGSNFVFLKLAPHPQVHYARSEEFVLENANDLERVLQILKQFAAIISQDN